MSKATIVIADEVPPFARGDGVITTLLIGKNNAESTGFTSGLTSFPPGRNAPMHYHNCDEQVTIIDGEGEVEVDGQKKRLKKFDTSYIPANSPHRFNNVGEEPLVILWIYAARDVTRTFVETGETVDHLSPGDLVT
jgi:quercetin dioxygenase-like cupin family protein